MRPVVGSIFTSNVVRLLTERIPPEVAAGGIEGANSITPHLVREMPQEVQDVIVSSYNDALTPVFLAIVPLALVALMLLVFVKEVPLRTSEGRDAVPESYGVDGGNVAFLEPHEQEPDAEPEATART